MAKIAYILLCHKDPEAIIGQAEMLTAAGDYMSIHFDARAKPEYYKQIKGQVRQRIGRNEFIEAFNTLPILAVTPIPSKLPVFQLQFFSRGNQ